MPPIAAELKPSPRCCCVLGTVADTTEIGSGHKAVLLRVALHAGAHEELMLAPAHAARAARQLVEAARACGESGKDVTTAELELAAFEPKPSRKPYDKPLPSIVDYMGAQPATQPAPSRPPAPLIPFRPSSRSLRDDDVQAAWQRYRAGEAPVHELAAKLGCSDTTLKHAFERLHGVEYQLIRTAYMGGRRGPEVRAWMDRTLEGVRLPIAKPNGKIL